MAKGVTSSRKQGRGRSIRQREKAEARALEAFQLRAEGYTFAEIADKMQVNVGIIHKLVKERLVVVQKEVRLVTEEYITLELEASSVGIQKCLEMIEALTPHLMTDMTEPPKDGERPKKEKVYVPNLEVFKEVRAWRGQIIDWRKHIADVTGVKSSNINHDFNIDAVAKKLKEGMKQMDESAGC